MSQGMNYAPVARTLDPVCKPFDLCFAVVHMDHGHIYGMAENLAQAGATCTHVFEPDTKKVAMLKKSHPNVIAVKSLDEILQNPKISLVVAAAIPNLRGPLGVQVMLHGKDYFTDKTPFTTLKQLERAKQVVLDTGKKYSVCYSERLQNESAEFAAELVREYVIGDVIQVIGLGPHRLSKPHRPDWFFRKEEYGGILCDIGSHQAEQFLTYTGATDASVSMARVANFANSDVPELEDFGEFSLVGDSLSGKCPASGYFRMDWFTPDGLRNWGDGRTTILGTKGFIECRKYIDLAAQELQENNVYIVTNDGEEKHNVTGKIGFPYFPAFVLDCLNRTELAMTQTHTFKAAEICLQAQRVADDS
ncbi:MAG: Gfo/Idh/MocA family oxidoreductase [Pseudomonadales bacterium]|jgi:predicted dehydrogenase